MESLNRERLLILIVLAALVSGCREVAVEYRIDRKSHARQRLGTLGKRADHALYRLNDHVFEYDLRPIGSALVYGGDQSARTLLPGESITSFIDFKPGLSSGAAHKTRFGGMIGRPKKAMTLNELKPGTSARSVLRFEKVNGRRWLVSSVFKDSAKQIIQAEVWASVVDGFLVTLWMHVDDLTPVDAKLRNTEVERLREVVRGFRYSP